MSLIVTQGYGDSGGVAPGALTVLSVTPSNNQILITFSEAVILLGDGLDTTRWIIVSDGGQHVIVNSIQVAGATVTLITNEMANGTNYTLTIPNMGVYSAITGNPLTGPFEHPFVGVGSPPTILIIVVIDARTIEVVYDEPVNMYDALNENNYVITGIGGLTVIDVEKMGSTIYRLTTSHQMVGTNYLVTASNIRGELDGL